LPMMLLHFGLSSPDHLIGCRRMVPLDGCQLIAALL
jgi:hypothetical protein